MFWPVSLASPLHDSFVFFPCLSDSLLFHPSHPLPPSPHLSSSRSSLPASQGPQTPAHPPRQQSSCDTPWREAISGRECILFSSHTTETADYNYFDSPPPVRVAGNSSCLKLLSCSGWMVGECVTFQWYIYSKLMNDKWSLKRPITFSQDGNGKDDILKASSIICSFPWSPIWKILIWFLDQISPSGCLQSVQCHVVCVVYFCIIVTSCS